jgi:hypothetical protein
LGVVGLSLLMTLVASRTCVCACRGRHTTHTYTHARTHTHRRGAHPREGRVGERRCGVGARAVAAHARAHLLGGHERVVVVVVDRGEGVVHVAVVGLIGADLYTHTRVRACRTSV